MRIKGKWKKQFYCKSCGHDLISEHVINLNSGLCPYCKDRLMSRFRNHPKELTYHNQYRDVITINGWKFWDITIEREYRGAVK